MRAGSVDGVVLVFIQQGYAVGCHRRILGPWHTKQFARRSPTTSHNNSSLSCTKNADTDLQRASPSFNCSLFATSSFITPSGHHYGLYALLDDP